MLPLFFLAPPATSDGFFRDLIVYLVSGPGISQSTTFKAETLGCEVSVGDLPLLRTHTFTEVDDALRYPGQNFPSTLSGQSLGIAGTFQNVPREAPYHSERDLESLASAFAEACCEVTHNRLVSSP